MEKIIEIVKLNQNFGWIIHTHIDRCVPFQIMSNQLNLPQVPNQVVETSQGWSVETGCTWTQFWVSWQRLRILMYMWFFFFFFFFFNLQTFLTNFFHVVIMGYCLQNFEENNELNWFWNKAVTYNKMWEKWSAVNTFWMHYIYIYMCVCVCVCMNTVYIQYTNTHTLCNFFIFYY